MKPSITIPIQMLDGGDPLEVMVYAVICVNAKYALTEEPEIFIPKEKLQYEIYKDKWREAYQVEKILEAAKGLEALGILRYDDACRGMFVKKEALYPRQFVMIEPAEFDAIRAETKPGYFQWLFFYHFCVLIDSINTYKKVGGRTNVVGFMPYSYFADKSDISLDTVRRYNKKLEDMKLIYFKRRICQTNIYCRYKDRGLLNNERSA